MSEPKNLDINTFENVQRPEKKSKESKTYGLILDVELGLSAILGEAETSLNKILNLTKGSIIELNNKTDEPIKLLANGVEVASGEVVIIEDKFGLRITNIAKNNILNNEDKNGQRTDQRTEQPTDGITDGTDESADGTDESADGTDEPAEPTEERTES